MSEKEKALRLLNLIDEDKMIFEFFKEITLPKYISFSSRLIRR